MLYILFQGLIGRQLAAYQPSRFLCSYDQFPFKTTSSHMHRRDGIDDDKELIYVARQFNNILRPVKLVTQSLCSVVLAATLPFQILAPSSAWQTYANENTLVQITSATYGEYLAMLGGMVSLTTLMTVVASRIVLRIYYDNRQNNFIIITNAWHFGMKHTEVKPGSLLPKKATRFFGVLFGNYKCQNRSYFLMLEHFRLPMFFNKLIKAD